MECSDGIRNPSDRRSHVTHSGGPERYGTKKERRREQKTKTKTRRITSDKYVGGKDGHGGVFARKMSQEERSWALEDGADQVGLGGGAGLGRGPSPLSETRRDDYTV